MTINLRIHKHRLFNKNTQNLIINDKSDSYNLFKSNNINTLNLINKKNTINISEI